MLKKCTPLWREAHFQVKHTTFRALLEVEMLKKCTLLWREAYFEVKSAKNWWVRSTLGRSDVVLRGRRKGLCTLFKVSKTWRFCSSFKNDGRRGTSEEDLASAVQETHEVDVLGDQGGDFLREVTLESWFCVTVAALRMTWNHFFVAGAVL